MASTHKDPVLVVLETNWGQRLPQYDRFLIAILCIGITGPKFISLKTNYCP